MFLSWRIAALDFLSSVLFSIAVFFNRLSRCLVVRASRLWLVQLNRDYPVKAARRD